MTTKNKDGITKSILVFLTNIYIGAIVIVFTYFCGCYIIQSYDINKLTSFNFIQNDRKIDYPDIWFFGVVLLVNLALTGKLKSFSLEKLGIGVNFSEVKSEVKQLQKDIEQLKDQLMTSAILDGYEFNTLKRLRDNNYGQNFQYNFHADLQLRHLYNIGFIEIIKENQGFNQIEDTQNFNLWLDGLIDGNIYQNKNDFIFYPETFFRITQRGKEYLKIHAQSELKTPVIDEYNQLFFLNSKQYEIYVSSKKELPSERIGEAIQKTKDKN